MDAMQWLEAASYTVTVIGLPFAFWVFWVQQKKERENEEEAAYQSLSDAYNDFLKVTLEHPDLRLRSAEPLIDPTPDQLERMRVIFEMLIALFERAYLISWREENINAYHQPGVEAGKKAAAAVLQLQGRVEACLKEAGKPMSADEVAQAIGEADSAETIFAIARHLAANGRLEVRRAERPYEDLFSAA